MFLRFEHDSKNIPCNRTFASYVQPEKKKTPELKINTETSIEIVCYSLHPRSQHVLLPPNKKSYRNSRKYILAAKLQCLFLEADRKHAFPTWSM